MYKYRICTLLEYRFFTYLTYLQNLLKYPNEAFLLCYLPSWRTAEGAACTHRLQFDRDALGVSAQGGHAAAECLPDDAVPLQGALAASLQAAQPPTQWRERDPGGEQGLDRPAG